MNTAGVDGTDSLTLLVLADLHYVGEASHQCPIPTRQAALGLELAQRAIRRTLRHVRPDALVLLGDLVDNGLAPGAQHDMEAIAHALEEFGLPILVAPGNHDVAADLVAHVFGHGRGLHVVNGYPIILLASDYGEDGSTTYREADLALVRDAAAVADRPLIVLQHNPVHPHIAGSYPYNPTNAEAIKACYAEAGVALSLSGHYHAGVPPERVDGVCYAMAPALCEAPFGFLEVR
ncbi:metallophosphoesterase, partial [bacterium]|nr:metallophosphoesterase [bacterium]